MLTEYIFKKALDGSLRVVRNVAKGLLSGKDATFSVKRQDAEESLNQHLRSVKNWSGEISFADLKKAKRTTDVFIELDLFVYPRRVLIDASETIESIPLQNIFDAGANHIVLLGQPGAGKTTSMKYLCQLLLHDDKFQKDRFNFPLLIKFRDLNTEQLSPDTTLLVDQIFRILGLSVKFSGELARSNKDAIAQRKSIREKLVISMLEELQVLLIFDGFDELATELHREKAIEEVSRLAAHLDRSSFIVTSRTGDFLYEIEGTDQYEICPLTKAQVASFSRKWLADEKDAANFLVKVYKTPFADTAIRPLTLAHLCAIYERVKDIPEKPKTVYKKIINLLLEEWDQQRAIKRKSKYGQFEVDRKYELLCQLAYILTVVHEITVFSTDDLLAAYNDIHEDYGLRAADARSVVAEIETHTGLLIQSGYHSFEFAHKSLQEFLTAEFLVKLPSIPRTREGLTSLPNELAIAVAISSSPGIYFAELVLSRFRKEKLSQEFVRAFTNRLLIEKPDFRTTVWLGLALLALSTKYIEADVVRTGRLESTHFDAVFQELERLVKAHYTESLANVLDCYDTKNIYESFDKDNLQRLILNQTRISDAIKPMLGVLPDYLLVRNSLFSSTPKLDRRSSNIKSRWVRNPDDR